MIYPVACGGEAHRETVLPFLPNIGTEKAILAIWKKMGSLK